MNKNARKLLTRLQKLGGSDGRGDMPGKDKALREQIDAYARELATPSVQAIADIADPEYRLVAAVTTIRELTPEITDRTARRNVALAIACKPAAEGGDAMKKTRAARRVARTRGFVHREAYGHTTLQGPAEVARVRAEYIRVHGDNITAIEVAQIEEAHVRYLEAVRDGCVDIRIQTVRELADRVEVGADGAEVREYPPNRIAALADMETSQVSYDLYTAGEGSRQRRYGGSDNLTTAQATAIAKVGEDGLLRNRGTGRVHLNTINALIRAGLAQMVQENQVEIPVPGRPGETQMATEYVASLTSQGWTARKQMEEEAA